MLHFDAEPLPQPPHADFNGVASGSSRRRTTSIPSHLELKLTARERRADGHEDRQLDPKTVDLTFNPNPAGLR